jgi:hypothetical protein
MVLDKYGYNINPARLEPSYSPLHPVVGPDSDWLPAFTDTGRNLGIPTEWTNPHVFTLDPPVDPKNQLLESRHFFPGFQHVLDVKDEEWSGPIAGYPDGGGAQYAKILRLKHLLALTRDGNNYFRASESSLSPRNTAYFSNKLVSTHIYGDPAYWAIVKALHIPYLESQLRQHDSPRHAHYTQLNTIGSPIRNLWQRLHTPYDWQLPETIMQITADLFDLYIVLYPVSSLSTAGPVTINSPPQVYGNYGSRHVFMRGCKEDGVWFFQPLIIDPELARADEFILSNNPGTTSLPPIFPKPILRKPTQLQYWLAVGWNVGRHSTAAMNLTLLNRTAVVLKERIAKEKLTFEDVHPVFEMDSSKEWPDLGIRRVKKDVKEEDEKKVKVEGGRGGLGTTGVPVVVKVENGGSPKIKIEPVVV